MQVLLDVESIQPDRILLLDSFFYVVVFHGTSIAQWRKEGYHLQEEHEGFRQLLEVLFPLAMHARGADCQALPAVVLSEGQAA